MTLYDIIWHYINYIILYYIILYYDYDMLSLLHYVVIFYNMISLLHHNIFHYILYLCSQFYYII